MHMTTSFNTFRTLISLGQQGLETLYTYFTYDVTKKQLLGVRGESCYNQIVQILPRTADLAAFAMMLL